MTPSADYPVHFGTAESSARVSGSAASPVSRCNQATLSISDSIEFGAGRFPACRGRCFERWFPSRPDRTGIDYDRRVTRPSGRQHQPVVASFCERCERTAVGAGCCYPVNNGDGPL